MKAAKTALSAPIIRLVKVIINQTPDGDLGHSEASDTVSETWDTFCDVGATISDLEMIVGYIRWRKFEGFCEGCPIK